MANVGDEIVENKLRKNEMETFLKLLRTQVPPLFEISIFLLQCRRGEKKKENECTLPVGKPCISRHQHLLKYGQFHYQQYQYQQLKPRPSHET